jgi:tetratricopeptide (TPR) repeat protein/predicted Ser/Thr protein kinase
MTDRAPTPDPLEALRAALGTQYAVERLLGLGGMGSVYLARDLTLDRPVAIKVINQEIAANPALRERFFQEARAVAKLRHPNIVPVYAAGESLGMLYFVMEFVPGESLREVVTREKSLAPGRAVRMLREVARALGHAHAHGLVHRDVKPENILIDQESGAARLTDFGVARAFETDGGLTQAGMILGSPRYMSPEQASGDRAIDGRSDLYSLALVGYELLTGAPVIESATLAGMLVKHITETPAPLGARVPGLPPYIAAAIHKGLAKNPEERWQTGEAFADALEGDAPGAPAVVTPPPPARQLRKVLLGAGAALVLILAAWLGLGKPAAADAGFLVAPFEIQSGDQSVAWLREGSVNMLTLTFGQWSDLNVVDYERTLSMLDAEGLGDKPRLSLDDAFALARRARAGTVVTGQVQTTTDSLIVVARLYDVGSGKSERQAQEGAALGSDPRPLFDRLAQQLLDIRGGRTSTMQLAQATTTSLEAYRAYLEGVTHLNAWRLDAADSAFQRALALDSTFTLAYHKRSLGLGWSEIGGPAYVGAATRAFERASRVPPRERSLIEGHYHLTQALLANNQNDTVKAQREYRASINSYESLIARGDSLAAEAWYGLADAYFHGRGSIMQLPNDSIRVFTTRSLRGFNRTLALDSTYHLAYSHLVQLYNAAAQGGNLVVSSDSSILITDSADVARLGGPEALRQLRAGAAERGLEIARAWASADTESPQPVLQLMQSYVAAQQFDSAVAVIDNSLARPASAKPILRLSSLALHLNQGDSLVAPTLRYILEHYTPDSLRSITPGTRFQISGFMLSAAGMIGSSADLERAAELFAQSDSVLPFTSVPTAPMLQLYRQMVQIAMGQAMTPELHRALLRSAKAIDTNSTVLGPQIRGGSQSLMYLAFLETRDTTFRNYLARWSTTPLPELDALLALAKGDSATARQIAQGFTAPDSLRNSQVRFGYGGMRSLARAEVLAAIGQPKRAAETLDATAVERINQQSLVEPGYAAWVRSWLIRARLWAESGERDRAIAAYEEFLRRWKDADGPAARLVRQARGELGALRDAPGR